MKYIFSTAVLSTIISISCLTAANAEPGSARFSFAPNIWKGGVKSAGTPEPPITRQKPQWHEVKIAKAVPSVPHDASFLGLDQQTLARPIQSVAPIATTQIAIVPTYVQILPQMSAKPMTQAFKSAFGQPINEAKKAAPQLAMAHTLPVAVQSVNAHIISPKVKKISRVRQSSLLAHANSLSSDSYGKNFGYVPGPSLFNGDGANVTTTTEVRGQIIHH